MPTNSKVYVSCSRKKRHSLMFLVYILVLSLPFSSYSKVNIIFLSVPFSLPSSQKEVPGAHKKVLMSHMLYLFSLQTPLPRHGHLPTLNILIFFPPHFHITIHLTSIYTLSFSTTHNCPMCNCAVE